MDRRGQGSARQSEGAVPMVSAEQSKGQSWASGLLDSEVTAGRAQDTEPSGGGVRELPRV